MEALIADALPVLGGVFGVTPRKAVGLVSAARGLTVETVSSLVGLEALGEEWRALERLPDTRTTPFQTHRFHMEWARRFAGAGQAFRIVTVRRDGRLALAMPLAVNRTPVGNVAGWMGDPLIQYGDVICAPSADIDALLPAAFESLRCDGDILVLDLRRVRADAACARWLNENVYAIGAADEAIGVDLTPFAEPDDYARVRSSRASRNRKRAAKLARLGDVDFRILEGGPEAAELVSTAFAMKQAWLDRRGVMGRALSDERMLDCLKSLARGGGATVSLLEVGCKPAAIEVALRHRGRHCAFLGAFDPDLWKLSPGQVQMQRTIEWCIGKGDRIYDLMAPADSYKRELGSVAVEVKDYTAVLSMKGLPAAMWTTFGRRGAKAAFESLPEGLRRAIRTRVG